MADVSTTRKKRRAKSRPLGSWDPFTQARYIFEIRKALGYPASFAREYASMVEFFAKEAEKSGSAAQEDPRQS